MTDKIYIQIGDKKQEAKGEALEQILKDQTEAEERARLLKAEMQAKQAKLDSAKAKLAALGLDEEEVAAIVGGI
jgi:Na+-translocating ferredoxin:NAD+ oxidoreductase RnfG subunit